MNIVDMHCDTIVKLLTAKKSGQEVSLFKNSGHLDIERMQQGGYLLQNFAVFTNLKEDDPFLHVQEAIDFYYQEIEKNKDYIHPVLRYEDILKNKENGYISAMLTLEEGDVVYDNLAILRNYYRLGVRMITLTWNYPNRLGYPNYNKNVSPELNELYDNGKAGLTPFGISYIQEMEQLGMIIDVSHLSDDGFFDVCKYTSAPFVASHSNARSVCGVSRNLTDEMIKELAKRGGVIGINYYGTFLCENPGVNIQSKIADIIVHIKHLKEIAGIDCIGLGSDFDGITGELELKDVSYLPELKEKLMEEGFTTEEIEKIFYKNVLRVYQTVLK